MPEAIQLDIREPEENISINTDSTLLLRVLTNMVKNAIEASDPGDTVKVWFEEKNKQRTFCVWNKTMIPENI